MLVIAHRGCHKSAQENSWKSFSKALEIGCHRIELDVHTTMDGEVVVNHDADLIKAAGVNKRIRDLRSFEIKNISLKNGEKIPILSELIDQLLPKIELNIEMKVSDLNSIDAVGKLCLSSKFSDKIIISSFDSETLKNFSKKYPTLKRAFLFDLEYKNLNINQIELSLEKDVANTKANYLHPELACTDLSLINFAKKNQLEIFPWVPMAYKEDAQIWAQLKTYGVTGLCTNDPTGMIEWMQKQ